jgi:anti-sigma B factor antagonist
LASEQIEPRQAAAALRPIQTTGSDDRGATIALRGELDDASVADLRAELSRHLDTGRRQIRIDAGGLTYIDSAILGELITIGVRCRREQGSLVLTNPSPRVRRIIEITGVDGLLLIDTAGDTQPHRPA